MSDPAQSKPLLVSIRDACKLLNIARSTYFTQRDAGRIGPEEIKIGRKILISVEELNAWVAAKCPPKNQWRWVAGR